MAKIILALVCFFCYNYIVQATFFIKNMYNWSVDEKQFKRANPKAYKIWRLEQMIHYHEPGEKLSESETRRNWGKLKTRIDPDYRRYLEFLLWPKKKAF